MLLRCSNDILPSTAVRIAMVDKKNRRSPSRIFDLSPFPFNSLSTSGVVFPKKIRGMHAMSPKWFNFYGFKSEEAWTGWIFPGWIHGTMVFSHTNSP